MSETVVSVANAAATEKDPLEMLKKEIQDVLSEDNAVLRLFFLLEKEIVKEDANENVKKKVLELRYVNFEDEKASKSGHQQLKDIYVALLKDRLLENSSAALYNLSSSDGTPDDIYLCDVPGLLPKELAPYLRFRLSEAVDQPKFNFTKDRLDELYGYIACIGTMDKWIALFTKHYPITVIKREAYLLGVLKDKERFEKVNEDDVLRITGKSHLLRIGDRTVVLDFDALERGMGYKKKIEDKAREIVNEMKDWNMFANGDELEKITEDYPLARKLVRAKKCSPVLAPPNRIPWGKVVKYIRDTPELSAVLKLDDAPKDKDKKISLPTQKARKMFVALLDDDYLQSALSEFLYVASHKKTVSEKKPASPTEEEQA